MIRRLYDRMIEIAAGPNALLALIVIAFAESSFFPIPPDVLLIPMMLARLGQRSILRVVWERPSGTNFSLVVPIPVVLQLAAYCMLASVVGGMLGYAIGYYGFDLIGRPILEFYHAMASYDALKAGFDRWGVWIIIIKGMTPIPYKLVTIASGVAHFDFIAFVGASIVSRSLRFFLLAALLWWFGPAVRDFIEKRLMLVTSAFAVCLVGGFLVIRYL